MQRPVTLRAHSPPRRAWLADAPLEPHPITTWLVCMGCDLWIGTRYQRVVVRPEDFQLMPGSLIASNHRRDVDGPLLGTVVSRREGPRFQYPLPFYAAREDLFRPGILARLTVQWPRVVSRLLGRISLGWFFPLGRCEPIRRVREFTLGETLRALVDAGLGDVDCALVLNRRGLRETGIRAGMCSVRAAASREELPLESWWALRRLRLSALQRLAPAFRATIAAQLAHFAARLDAGRCVYFSPEGTISRSGRFGRVRAGFFELVHTTRSAPWIQPVAIAYDALAPGRLRVVTRIGEHFRADTTLARRAFNAALKRRVLELVPITPSHLLGRFLLHGPVTFTREDLAGWLADALVQLRTRHASLDPLLTGSRPYTLAGQRLRWLERKRVIVREGDRWRNTIAKDAPPGWHSPACVARYLDNTLADVLPDVGRILRC